MHYTLQRTSPGCLLKVREQKFPSLTLGQDSAAPVGLLQSVSAISGLTPESKGWQYLGDRVGLNLPWFEERAEFAADDDFQYSGDPLFNSVCCLESLMAGRGNKHLFSAHQAAACLLDSYALQTSVPDLVTGSHWLPLVRQAGWLIRTKYTSTHPQLLGSNDALAAVESGMKAYKTSSDSEYYRASC